MSADLKEADVKKLDEMLAGFDDAKGSLIAILQKAQDIFGYLPRSALVHISERTGISLSKIFGVVTFYAQFHLDARGRNIIRSCQGTACHVRGAGAVMAEIRKVLGLADGENTTKDGRFTIEGVACLGCCGLAPVIMVNGETHGRLEPSKVKEILDRYQ